MKSQGGNSSGDREVETLRGQIDHERALQDHLFAVLDEVCEIVAEPLDERGHGPTREQQFARIETALREGVPQLLAAKEQA